MFIIGFFFYVLPWVLLTGLACVAVDIYFEVFKKINWSIKTRFTIYSLALVATVFACFELGV